MLINPLQTQVLSTLSLIIPLFLALPAGATEPAHEHGVARISIAVEGHEIEIEMIVAGADAVGFEHTASSDREKQAVVKAAKVLRDVNRIITLSPEADCRAEEVEVISGLMEDRNESSNQNHDHQNKAKNKDGHAEVHSEFIAHYHFHCEFPSKLTQANVGFFKMFPSAHQLEARWITPRGQGTSKLTATSPSLTF